MAAELNADYRAMTLESASTPAQVNPLQLVVYSSHVSRELAIVTAILKNMAAGFDGPSKRLI
jgi:hypothetical protein